MWLEIAEKRWDVYAWEYDGEWYLAATQDDIEDEFLVWSLPCHDLAHFKYMVLALIAGIQNSALDA